ncbi:MAG: nuclease [Chlorobiaceae bacterium]|nr:nuclease [Chlorobiaceae bacterium]
MSTLVFRRRPHPLFLLLLLLFVGCHDTTSSARVVKVADGDTITVLHNDNTQEKIRLYGIDSPEKTQPFGTRARQYISTLVFGKQVTMRTMSRDRYGRSVAWVSVGETNVNAEMVKAGYAWHYRQYSDDPALQQFENEARKAKRGLWADPHPVAPWDYRKGNRTTTATSGTTNRQSHSLPAKSIPATTPSEAIYHGNVSSRKFHRPECPSYNCKACTAIFSSRAEAMKAGYKPCRTCQP